MPAPTRSPSTAKRAPRLIAAAFVAMFGVSVLTVIYTGLLVEAPRTELAAGLPAVAMVVGERRDVNLVFTSSAAIPAATLRITLPRGFELIDPAGAADVRWGTRLEAGDNILPLAIMAAAPGAGQVVARLEHGGREKVFRVRVSARLP